MSQPQRSSRRQKIEPLSWTEAARAPALKGMTSFLDVSAEDVRNGTFGSSSTETLLTVSFPDVDIFANEETCPGDETPPADSSDVYPLRHAQTSEAVPQIARRMPFSTNPQRGSLKPAPVTTPASFVTAGVVMGSRYVASPGYETYPDVRNRLSLAAAKYPNDKVTPGRGRSKVRKCVLAQDGHSLGEEAIYQVMWRSGRPENSDPNGSRTVRIGAADLGYKVNMAKKNVRQNISRLFEKLAVEIIEDFETMSSQARMYRVYSYKQILERRRAAGLEYVLRNKGVVFCSSNGEEIVASPAYVLTPGDETSIKPAPPKKRRVSLPQSALSATVLPPAIPNEESSMSDLQVVIQALNRYWPVDQAAAVQLLRDCRRVRPDARADEIAFFVREKLELARSNRNITNPTGLIIATVPQSFVGSSFEEFRGRMNRQATLAAEEQQRKEREREELSIWLLKERERCEAIVGDPNQTEKDRDAAENRLRQLASWNP